MLLISVCAGGAGGEGEEQVGWSVCARACVCGLGSEVSEDAAERDGWNPLTDISCHTNCRVKSETL